MGRRLNGETKADAAGISGDKARREEIRATSRFGKVWKSKNSLLAELASLRETGPISANSKRTQEKLCVLLDTLEYSNLLEVIAKCKNRWGNRDLGSAPAGNSANSIASGAIAETNDE